MLDKKLLQQQLAPELIFKPFPIPDPVPYWYVEHLDKAALTRLVEIEMETRNEVLEASLKANARALEMIKGVGRGAGH